MLEQHKPLFVSDPENPTQKVRWEVLCTVSNPNQPLPVRSRTDAEREKLEAKVDWFYKARFGIMAHFLPNMARFTNADVRIQWTTEQWQEWVDAVDVEKFADQATEIGAGYVMLSIGQQGNYYCSPNPVLEKHWGFSPFEYSSKRDLPADLAEALHKRGIPMMLYVTGHPFATEGEAYNGTKQVGWEKRNAKPPWSASPKACEKWRESVRWWVEHYKDICAGYWVDGLNNYATGHAVSFMEMIREVDPEAVISTWYHALSDYTHGHCTGDWDEQQRILPPNGRWMPTYGIQWHAFQYLGHKWGASDTPHTTETIVDYAYNVVARQGVITLDIGTFDESGTPFKGPYLEIPPGHMQQLHEISDAVKDITRDS